MPDFKFSGIGQLCSTKREKGGNRDILGLTRDKKGANLMKNICDKGQVDAVFNGTLTAAAKKL